MKINQRYIVSLILLFSIIILPISTPVTASNIDNTEVITTVESSMLEESLEEISNIVESSAEVINNQVIVEDLFIDIAEPLEVGYRSEEEAEERKRLSAKIIHNLQEQTRYFAKTIQKAYEEYKESEANAAIAYKDSLFAKGSNVPNDDPGCKSKFKSWMRASSIKAKKSGQWQLLHNENCYEDPETKFMMYHCEDGTDRVCCALGSYYTELIGTKVDILFEDGHIVQCILADQKANEHTDKSNRYHLCDGSVLEFVVGPNFKGDDTYPDWIYGKIYRVEVLDAVNDGKGFEWLD